MHGNVPENCNECHDRHVCGAAYGSANCYHREAIELLSKVQNSEKAQNFNAKGSDVVGNPQHYKHGRFEVIDEMLLAFGPQRTYDFCILNAWKYRARAPYKGNAEQDLAKADQYLSMAREIAEANKDVMNYGQAPVGLIKEQ